jgi:bifunctional non-homologous end joining protein LigD
MMTTMMELPAPMLATNGRPCGALGEWHVEPKLDGWRAMVGVDAAAATVRTRRGRAVHTAIPEVTALAELGVDVVLDGEIIVGDGRPADFYRLAGALSARRPAAGSPVSFVAFDVLRLDGIDLLDRPQHERRRLLDHLAGLVDGDALPVVPTFPGVDIEEVLASCEAHAVEGVVAKHRDATYRPGARSAAWRKIKCSGWETHRARRFAHVETAELQ